MQQTTFSDMEVDMSFTGAETAHEEKHINQLG